MSLLFFHLAFFFIYLCLLRSQRNKTFSRGANYSLGACKPDFKDFRSDFRDFKDFRPDFKVFRDFKDLKYSNGFRPDFKEFRSGVRDFGDLNSGFMGFGPDFRDFRSDSKGFRPYSRDFTSDLRIPGISRQI